MYKEKVSGKLNRGFQGHIKYVLWIPDQVRKLKLRLEFDKRELITDMAELSRQCKKALLTNMPEEIITDELLETFVKMPKGEINLSLSYNGAVVGTMHRNELIKEAEISAEKASRGFIRTSFKGGLLEVTLHCLNIVNDETNYELILEGY